MLLYDAIPQMRHSRRCDYPRSFQLDLLVADVGEQWPTCAEQDVCDVNLHLVYQSGLQVLLTDIRAHQTDVPVTGGGLCLFQGAFYPVGNEDECGWSPGHRFMRAVREHKHLPKHGRVVTPRFLGNVEGSSSQDTRPEGFHGFFEQLSIGISSAVEHPLMEYPTAVAQPIAGAVVRPGHKTVQGHGDVYNDFSHFLTSHPCLSEHSTTNRKGGTFYACSLQATSHCAIRGQYLVITHKISRRNKSKYKRKVRIEDKFVAFGR